MTEAATYISKEGDMVDNIAYQYYGTSAGTTEAILDANPGLANYDVLPAGLAISLPAVTATSAVAAQQLWD